MQTGLPHISRNTVQGSLQDASIPRLLDSCRKSLVNARIDVDAGAQRGFIELRAGAVEEAGFGDLTGTAALQGLRGLHQGNYEISQRLPGLDGHLGGAAAFRGELTEVSLIELMRHCEDNALTCKLILIHEFDRGEIEYRSGEIERVKFNGEIDEDRIVDMVRLRDARFLVMAPPLDLGVQGWPVVRGDPTAPFRFADPATRPPPRPATAPPAPAEPDQAEAGCEALVVASRAATNDHAALPPRPRGGLLRRRIGALLRRVSARLGGLAEQLSPVVTPTAGDAAAAAGPVSTDEPSLDPPIEVAAAEPVPTPPAPATPPRRSSWLRRLLGRWRGRR